MKLRSSQEYRPHRWALLVGIVLPIMLFLCAVAGVAQFKLFYHPEIPNIPLDQQEYMYCGPDGKVWAEALIAPLQEFANYWNPSLFLTVTLGFTGLNFAQAKTMDIVFDLIIGRGSQGLLALLAYPIIHKAVVRSLEARKVSFKVLFSLFLYRFSVTSLWELFRSTCTGSRGDATGSKGKMKHSINWRMPLIFLITLHLLLSPTILSAATSYQSIPSMSVPLPGTTETVPFSDFTQQLYTIQDGDRIGLTKDYAVTSGSDFLKVVTDYWDHVNSRMQLFNTSISAGCEELEKYPETLSVTDDENNPPHWSFYMNATQLAEKCRHSLLPDVDSTILVNGKAMKVERTPLIITPFYPFTIIDDDVTYFYKFLNFTVNDTYIMANGICQQTDKYIWGVSMLMLLTYCVACCIVGLFLLILQWDVWWYSQANRYKTSISPYRDAMDLCQELNEQYEEEDVKSMPPKELDRLLSKQPIAVSLETDDLPMSRRRLFANHSNKSDTADNDVDSRRWKLVGGLWSKRQNTDDSLMGSDSHSKDVVIVEEKRLD